MKTNKNIVVVLLDRNKTSYEILAKQINKGLLRILFLMYYTSSIIKSCILQLVVGK